jgi:hypothetical protein
MSLEGTIRDLGLQEVGQLLSLSRKSGVLVVRSRLRALRGWIRFVDGAITDAGVGDPLPDGTATSASAAGERPVIEEVVLDLLAWREGSFAFVASTQPGAGDCRVRIPTDAMLVESARRDDAWSRLRDRVPSADAIPSFVDVEPKALPLLHLVPQEWEVLTRVDGERDLRTLAGLLQRDVVEVAETVHGLVGTGLLTVRDGSVPLRPTPLVTPAIQAEVDDLWIPATAEMAVFAADADDVVFDPMRAGLLNAAGMPHALESAIGPVSGTVTVPASGPVASTPSEPSSHEERHEEQLARRLAAQGDEAARRGDFETALACWSRYLRAHERAPDADRVREAIGLVARLHALLGPESRA